MALPPGFLDELRVRTPIAALVGRRVRLTRSGRQWKGCCPFHGEKTPSFYVYEDHFHCFGCGAHGDAISFVMQSQGLSFTEAVNELAAEAGLEVPRPSPEAAEADRRRLDLHGVLQAAKASFQRRLLAPEGRAALDYLRGRGVSDAAIERFGLGWSGEGRGALAADLGRAGIEPRMLAEAGLTREAEGEGGRYTDLFFNRVMFPIADRRCRVVSFGGRSLGATQPKYVNGPETTLFSKRRTLYGADLAREGLRNGAKLVVVEGYMDVISLHEAGFTGAVAPLGTALTDEQLVELWRLSPQPLLCFDGDAAGRRAALRAAELALPHLEPDRSLGVVPLPEGADPDSLVRREGVGRFRARLDAPRSLPEAIYDLLQEGVGHETPEQRAAFQSRLEATARAIRNKPMATAYRRAFLDRFFARPPNRPRNAPNAQPLRRTLPHLPIDPAATGDERARILLAILVRHPALVHDVEHAFADLPLAAPLARLREALLSWAESADTLDSPRLIDHLEQVGLARETASVLASEPFPLPGCAGPDTMPAEAASGWWHFYGLMREHRLNEDIALASRELERSMSEASQRRLIGLKSAQASALLDQGEADA